MVSLSGRKVDTRAAPTQLNSRLLAEVLDEQRLAELETINVLDFGRANSASLEFFNQFPCRLCVLDCADALLEWSGRLALRLQDDPPSPAQMQLELSGLLGSIGEHRYDLVFLWDTLNHLHEHALPTFANLLRRHVTARMRGHGFMLQKRGAEQRLRRLEIAAPGVISVCEEREIILYPHGRRSIDQALGAELELGQGVLASDGRLEFLLRGRPRAA